MGHLSTLVETAIHNSLTTFVRYAPVERGKRRVVSALWKPLCFGQYEREVRLRLLPVRMVCDVRQLIQREIYFFRGYEDTQCRMWIERAKRARVIFDVGANVGIYSLLAARANPGADIHAFEPSPDVCSRLKRNIDMNEMRNIHVQNVGIAASTGTAFLHVCTGSNGQNEGMNFVSEAPSERAFNISVTSLDAYCQANDIATIDLMKMDIEGGEYAALKGAARMLRRQAIRCLFFELVEWSAHRSGHSRQAIADILRNAGYGIFESAASGALVPVPEKALPKSGEVIAMPT